MNELPRIRKESGVFWVEVDKIRPNSMQPRRTFDEIKLGELAESIRQYGVLQPLVVIRHEREVPTGTVVEYEIIAGERRWRASRQAGLTQVPVIIREDPSEKVKLELALIENLQREDLGPLERAEAFKQLVDQFKMRHHEVGAKMGKSREFVSNTIRLLTLPEEILEGLRQGLIFEGHTRPLLSLAKQKDEQLGFYKEIIYRKMTVREAELLSREIVRNRITRKIKDEIEDPETQMLQQKLSDALGTRVSVERKGPANKISIEFFSEEELNNFLAKIGAARENSGLEPEPEIDVNSFSV
ncbi:ParB/RepB/Spo0J family partition protein [Patescibacteria group bacterium]|nr:ParB/RepB/Spo0J family partition protein [Patescibacteria group bacterium]